MLQLIYQWIATPGPVEKSLLERVCIILRPASWSTVLISRVVMVRVFEKIDFQKIYHATDFCNILRNIVKSKAIQTFKKLLKSESVSRSDLINSVYRWLNSSILLSHVFLKSRRDCRLKFIFMCIIFLCSFFYSLFKHKSVYNDIKLYQQIEVFTPEYLNANNKLYEVSWILNIQFSLFRSLSR